MRFTSIVGIPVYMKKGFLFFLIVFCFGTVGAQDPRENFKFAKFNFDKGEYEEALKFLDKALKADSAYTNAYFLRASTYLELRQYYNVIVDINRILKIDPIENSSWGNYLLARGKAFLALEDFDNAEMDLQKCIKLTNGDPEGYFYLAKLRFATRNYEESKDQLEKAIRKNGKNARYYAFRAQINIAHLKPQPRTAHYRDILSDINVAISLDPDNYEYYKLRSDFQSAMGEKEKALEDYDTMIRLSPKKDDAYTSRGLIKMNNYEYQGAALDFTRSILLNPAIEENYRYRGLCYNNLNNHKEAYKDFTKSIDMLTAQLEETAEKEKIKNTLAETYILRGHCLNLMGNNAQACRDFLMAHNLGIRKGLNYYRKYCGIY